MRLTESQRAAIEHRGASLLVAASAGSGKTEVLARRCVDLIADPRRPCPVERLLVVTFTRAAAAELRVRVARMLREAADDPHHRPVREHLRRQEMLVDAADIGTIDSWCGRLLREHFAEAGVDPAFAVLDEQEAAMLRAETLDALFDWIYREDGDELAARGRAWIRRHERPSDEFLRRLVRALNHAREHLVLPEQWLARQLTACERDASEVAAADLRLATGALRTECMFQERQIAALTAGQPELGAALADYATALARWADRLTSPDTTLEVAEEIDAFKLATRSTLPDSAAARFKQVRERWLKRRLQGRWGGKELEPRITHAGRTAALLQTLLGLEQRYETMLAAAKRERAAYEFGDVLRLALRLLGTPRDEGTLAPTVIARELRQRYEHVLVDEYQDTSPVQVELLRLVTRTKRGAANRFMVGDVKQSIYGFRHADPRLFAAQAAAFENGTEDGRVIYLSDNFRSHPDLLGGLNRIFAAVFDAHLGGTPFSEREQLSAGREEIANPTLDGTPRIRLCLLESERGRSASADTDDGGEVTLERIEREAVVTAAAIRQMLADGVEIPDRDDNDQLCLRPLRLSDILILLRSAKSNAALVASMVRAHGLPCVTGGKETLLDALEVQDVINVLRLLASRRQEIPLAAYLRSPLAGLTAAELLAIRQLAPHDHFWDAVKQYRASGLDAALVAKLEQALGRLENWSIAARDSDLPTLLRRIAGDCDLEHFAAGLPGGRQRAGVLTALVDYAVEFAHKGQRGVAEFVEHLDQVDEQELDLQALVPAGDDAVRVMTIHSAKGLEFPVVFVLNAGAPFNRQSLANALQFDEQAGLGLRFLDYPSRTELTNTAHLCCRHARQARDIEEELRLLYVATTRARERLFIIGHTQRGAWDEALELYRDQPPLITRLSAGGMLEWVLMGVAAGRLTDGEQPLAQVDIHDSAAITEEARGGEGPEQSPPPLMDADHGWMTEARRLLDSRIDSALSGYPAVLSVSALKELATRDSAADCPHMPRARESQLAAPVFAREAASVDGRVYGTACHRFLQHADLTKLAGEMEVQAQIASLVAAGRLEHDQAALLSVADLVWFGQSAEGDLLAKHADRCLRELPLVYSLPTGIGDERSIIRGVVDCLLATDAGYVLYDYKSDDVADQATMRRRVEGYSVQMQLYAAAVRDILGQPVKRAALIFLTAHTVVEIGLESPTLGRLLESLG